MKVEDVHKAIAQINKLADVEEMLHLLTLKKLSISDNAQKQAKTLPKKPPVSILQEMLDRKSITPKYELLQVDGVQGPPFKYRVTVVGITAQGTGQSKKAAKHAAASAVLDTLDKIVDNKQEIYGVQTKYQMPKNCIGELEAVCASRYWPLPIYTLEKEAGPEHERVFSIACSISKYRKVGEGKTKKLAKRHAAEKMWKFLHNANGQSAFVINKDESENTKATKQSKLKDGDIHLIHALQETLTSLSITDNAVTIKIAKLPNTNTKKDKRLSDKSFG